VVPRPLHLVGLLVDSQGAAATAGLTWVVHAYNPQLHTPTHTHPHTCADGQCDRWVGSHSNGGISPLCRRTTWVSLFPSPRISQIPCGTYWIFFSSSSRDQSLHPSVYLSASRYPSLSSYSSFIFPSCHPLLRLLSTAITEPSLRLPSITTGDASLLISQLPHLLRLLPRLLCLLPCLLRLLPSLKLVDHHGMLSIFIPCRALT